MTFAIVIAVCACFACISYFRYHNWANPFGVFNILWFIVSVLILAGNRFVDIPNSMSSKCILVGILGFNLSIYSRRLTIGKQKKYCQYRLNQTLVYVFSCIIVLMMASDAVAAIKNVMTGTSFSQIRTNFFGYETTIDYYIRNFFVLPAGYAVIAAAIMTSFSPEAKKKRGLMINAGIIVIFQAITSGGRYILINTFFMVACCYLLRKKQKKVKFTSKIMIALLIVFLWMFVLYITENRSSRIMENMSIWQKIYTTGYLYFAGSVTYLGKILEASPEVIASTFGINFIAGFISPIFAALNYLHILPYPSVFSVIGTKACVQLAIGPNSFYNAMPTIFGYFFIDGGYILTFIEAWLFGYIAKRTFARAGENNDLFLCAYLLVFVQICISSTRWMIYSPEFALAFLYVRLFCVKSKRLE